MEGLPVLHGRPPKVRTRVMCHTVTGFLLPWLQRHKPRLQTGLQHPLCGCVTSAGHPIHCKG